MKKTFSTLPLIVGIAAIALIVAVSAWVMRSRPSQEERALSEATSQPAPNVLPVARSNQRPVASAPPLSVQDLITVQKANDEAVSKLVAAGKDKLLRRYESERVDPAWATRKQQTLERLSISPQIEQVNAQPLSFNAQCRTSVCVINADFASRLAADDWFTLYTLNAGGEMFNASLDSTVNADGSVHLDIYGSARQ